MGAGAPTILVIDGEQGFLDAIEGVLKRQRFNVFTASSGHAALDWLARHRPDLMLLDLKLRDIEGQELINHLVSVNQMVPFIVITGQGDERVAVDMMKRGALDYLVKDVDFIQFLPELVRRALDQLKRERRLREAEDALRRTEATLAHAQSVAHVGGYQFSLPQAKRLHWSAETFRILGLESAEKEPSLAQYLNRIVHPEDRKRIREAGERTVKKGIRYEAEYRIVRPDGSIRYVHSAADPIIGPNKKVVRVVGMLQDITERKELEKEVREISEHEQRRIGQDLHDGLGQQLTALEIMCNSLRIDLASARPALEPHAARICQCLRNAIKQTRLLAHSLAPFKVGSGGLQTALIELAQANSGLGGVQVSTRDISAAQVEDNEAAVQLFRIAQEAVNNAVKHSGGSELSIELAQTNGTLRLRVADNGRGMRQRKRPHSGMGLRLMKHRAGLIGAHLAIESARGKGVTVNCTLPTAK
jgi:PAS domain S-box-containing protein